MNRDEKVYLQSLKKKDHYHFSIPFEYIVKNYGNDKYDIGTETMEVDFKWDNNDLGYVVSYYCPNIDKIRIDEGNGDVDEIYLYEIEDKVLRKLRDIGITCEALVFGDGKKYSK